MHVNFNVVHLMLRPKSNIYIYTILTFINVEFISSGFQSLCNHCIIENTDTHNIMLLFKDGCIANLV
jgi:hypothetical protein